MKDVTIPALIIGLFVAFGVGFLVGSGGKPEVIYPFPSNYNPTLAVESQGLKAAQETSKLCFDLIAKQLEHKQEQTAH